MRDTIFMKNSENKLVSLSETLYQKEEHLQEIIANNPVLLAGEQINPDEPRKWILIFQYIIKIIWHRIIE